MEKRTAERVKKKLKAEVQTKDGLTFSTSLDLSTGGVFISTPEPIKPGTEITLSLKIPGTLLDDIRCVSKWNNQDETEDEDRAGMGIQFVDLSEHDFNKIKDFLQS